MPVLIYPNPLNPKRYVVLNSGFTFREYDYLNNARQVPKLPDFAVVDIDVPVSARSTRRHRGGRVLYGGMAVSSWKMTDGNQNWSGRRRCLPSRPQGIHRPPGCR